MSAARRARALPWTSLLLAVLVVAATALGGLRAAGLAQHRPGPRTLEVDGVAYTVTGVDLLTGLSDQDLGGMAHGVQGLVPTDRALVSVRLTVSADEEPAHYDPATLRAASSASDEGTAPSGASFAAGRLAAHGSVEGSLSYVVPRDGAELVLRAGHGSRSVALLRLDQPTEAPHRHEDPAEHHHSEAGGARATGSPS